MIRYKFDVEKAIEILLYITEKTSNVYNVLKVVYFADKDHLRKYGRLICGDSYVAMSKGPVPSGLYDIVKFMRGDGPPWFNIPDKNALSVVGHDITPNRSPNLDLLSESDIECLDEAIEVYGFMSFGDLLARSHGSDWKSADENDFISLDNFIRSIPEDELPNPEELIEHVMG